MTRRHLKNQEGGWGHGSWGFIGSMSPSVTSGPSPSSSLENPKFPGILARLEESPVCQRLPLTSFLILPFQRITRLKMLVEVRGGHRATVRAVGGMGLFLPQPLLGNHWQAGLWVEVPVCLTTPTSPSRTS